jgi:hypothetical protein
VRFSGDHPDFEGLYRYQHEFQSKQSSLLAGERLFMSIGFPSVHSITIWDGPARYGQSQSANLTVSSGE